MWGMSKRKWGEKSLTDTILLIAISPQLSFYNSFGSLAVSQSALFREAKRNDEQKENILMGAFGTTSSLLTFTL